ncbi:MAG: autophagy protein 5 [Caeruleum heppii]|nr:MAG: autophagy protein 5 [Caeruleum heppii]
MPRPPDDLTSLQQRIWAGSLPLQIRLAPADSRTYDQTDPYLIHLPRLTYLPFLLPRLHAFFLPNLIDPPSTPPHEGWFSSEGVPLKWHYPVGLLYDLFSGAEAVGMDGGKHNIGEEDEEDEEEDEDKEEGKKGTLPWRLDVHFSGWPDEQLVRLDGEGRVVEDAWINAVKEADFLRNGTAKNIMFLSKQDSTTLWEAVRDHDLPRFETVNQKLLNPRGVPLRHIPLKIYLPASTGTSPAPTEDADNNGKTTPSLRVLQVLIPPWISPQTNQPQTLGTALHTHLPALFPSRRIPTLAYPVLHGAVVPLGTVLEELLRSGGAYLDGWVHLGLRMMG